MEPCVYDYFPSRLNLLVANLSPDTLVSKEDLAAMLGVEQNLLDQLRNFIGLQSFKIAANGELYRWGDLVIRLSKQI